MAMLRDSLGGRGMGAGGNMGEVAAAIAKGQGEGLGGRAGEAIWPLNGDNTRFGFPPYPSIAPAPAPAPPPSQD